jgi:hypothetical protein
LRRPKRDTNIEKTSKNFLTYADHLKTAQMVGVFLLKGGISMELKASSASARSFSSWAGWFSCSSETAASNPEAAKRPAEMTGRDCSVVS